MAHRLSLEDLSYMFHLANAEQNLYHLMLQSFEPSHTLTLLAILKEIQNGPASISGYQRQTVRTLLQQVEQTPSSFECLFPVFRREIQAAIKAYFKIYNDGIFSSTGTLQLPA